MRKPAPSSLSTLLSLHLAVMLFGISGIFGKTLSMGAGEIVFWRTLFSAVPLGLFAWYLGKDKPSRRILISQAVAGFLLAVHWITFYQSIKVSTVAIGLLSFCTFSYLYRHSGTDILSGKNPTTGYSNLPCGPVRSLSDSFPILNWVTAQRLALPGGFWLACHSLFFPCSIEGMYEKTMQLFLVFYKTVMVPCSPCPLPLWQEPVSFWPNGRHC